MSVLRLHLERPQPAQIGCVRQGRPDGQITSPPDFPPVHPFSQKYSDFQKPQITAISLPSPSHSEGRFADVTDAGRVAVDVKGAF
jgi:hypothetical protein